jgi:hypothetical protein
MRFRRNSAASFPAEQIENVPKSTEEDVAPRVFAPTKGDAPDVGGASDL